MKSIFTKPQSPLRRLFPLLQKGRQFALKFADRVGARFVISGGRVQFLDASLNFPEKVGLVYSTQLYWNGSHAYEKPTSLTLARLIGKSKVFLDVGSNVGIYAVYAGVKHPEVTTYAFEPVPSIWKKNVLFHEANGLSAKGVIQAAVGDSDGTQELILPVSSHGLEEEQTGTLNAESWQKREKVSQRITIKSVTLDRFTLEAGLPPGNVTLKIDVENFEAAVFRGARTFIESRRPAIVCEILPWQRFHPVTGERSNDNEEVVGLIHALNYAIFAITDDGYFRISPGDFAHERNLKDFLLLPADTALGSFHFFSGKELDRFLG